MIERKDFGLIKVCKTPALLLLKNLRKVTTSVTNDEKKNII